MDDKQKITLMIGDMNFPLRISREEELAYREASKLINNTLNKYRTYFEKADPVQVVSMAALEIAVEKVKLESRNDTAPFIDKLEGLTRELEDYFRKD